MHKLKLHGVYNEKYKERQTDLAPLYRVFLGSECVLGWLRGDNGACLHIVGLTCKARGAYRSDCLLLRKPMGHVVCDPSSRENREARMWWALH